MSLGRIMAERIAPAARREADRADRLRRALVDLVEEVSERMQDQPPIAALNRAKEAIQGDQR